jgi:hypothetical protein
VIPSKLITVRTYGSDGPASVDRELLVEAGIPAYVKWLGPGFVGVSLMVPEADADRALDLLSSASPRSAAQEGKTDPAITCPYCGSSEVDPRPPYLFIPLAAALVSAVALSIKGSLTLAFSALFAGFAVAAIAYRAIARWRCRSCGRAYSE